MAGTSVAVDLVVDHLGLVRGGWALSSVDGKLLLDWLERGIPASMIVLAIDVAMERRRARRTRTPFSLRSCRADVEALASPGRRRRGRRPRTGHVPMGQGVSQMSEDCAASADLSRLASEAIARIEALPRADRASLIDAAMSIVRQFHSTAWAASTGEHQALQDQAERELADLRSLISPDEWREAVDDLAQDLLHRRWPQLSASAIWDRLQATLPDVATSDPGCAEFSATR